MVSVGRVFISLGAIVITEQGASEWIGRKVVTKYHYPIESGNVLVGTQNCFHLYTVERVDSDCFWVTSGNVKGSIPISQVVLFDMAIDFYTQEIASNLGNSEAWRERGIIWTQKKEYDKAIADFNETIRLAPNDVIAYFNRGTAWLVKEVYESAIADFNEAIRLNPKFGRAYGNRGIAWRAKKKTTTGRFPILTKRSELIPTMLSTTHTGASLGTRRRIMTGRSLTITKPSDSTTKCLRPLQPRPRLG